MEYTRLGNTGLSVSRICLGCMTFGSPEWRDWVLDEAASRPLIHRALDLGINFLDTADVYSQGASETVLGNIVKGMDRESLVIATKVNGPMGPGPNDRGLSRKHIMAAIDASLARLQMDYVDLYQIHRFDRHTPIEETMAALAEIVAAGKARYIGASSMYAWQFAKMQHTAESLGLTPFVAMQNHYNLVYREEEREMNPLCIDQGVGLIPWSPLARGFLSGTRSRDGGGDTTRAKSDTFAQQMYYQDNDFAVVEACQQIARQRGHTSSQIALAWLLARPGVAAPIIGTSRMPHLEEAIAAIDIQLQPEEIQHLEAPYIPHPVLGHR